MNQVSAAVICDFFHLTFFVPGTVLGIGAAGHEDGPCFQGAHDLMGETWHVMGGRMNVGRDCEVVLCKGDMDKTNVERGIQEAW